MLAKYTHIKAVTTIVITICTLAAVTIIAQAQECDFPLPIQRTMANGNVMFLLDSSDSMNEIVYHDEYDPNITYAGGLDPGILYEAKKDGNYSPADFDRNLATIPTVYLVNSDNSYAGLYRGNYLNWLFYHAKPEQIATMPLLTRIQAEKAVITELIMEFNPDESPTGTLRFGVTVFNASGAGMNMLSKIGSPREVVLNAVSGVSANTPTPLAEAMVDLIDYFSLPGNLAPIEYSCQKTFLVVCTDGYPTNDLDVPAYIGDYDRDGNEPGDCASIGAPFDNSRDCSDYMDDVALYMFENDLRPDMDDKQNVMTYVVGFNIDAPLLAETAAHGDGLYLTATSLVELKAALRNVLRDIIRRISSGSAVAIVSVEGESEDHLLRAKYLPVRWQGYLEAFTLPYEVGDRPIWEAGEILADRDASSRTIYTTVNGQLTKFDKASAGILRDPMNLATEEEAVDVIVWTRGDDIPGYRNRGVWKLGDVVDSSPVVVGPPAWFSFDDEFMEYREKYATRPRAVYIGANDGMLHAFDEESGQENWAFIPESQLPKLKSLADTTYCHLYSVNLTPKVADVKVQGLWRTVLFGGMKHGGNGFFALDVTNPKDPIFLWESRIPMVLESWTQPEVVVLKESGKTVVIVGSGPDEVNGEAYVMALDMQDGSLVWSELLSVSATGDVNMATAAEAIDIDYDGYEDIFYISDLAGHVWRYNLKTFPPSQSLLFKTDQPIQSEPIITVDYNLDVYLYFGTGRYIDPVDFIDVTTQTFYCVIDKHDEMSATRWDLVDQTSSITQLTPGDRGWFVDLVQGAGERIVEPTALVAGVVYFTSFKPQAEMCQFGGFSWLYAMKFKSGAAYDDDDDDSNDVADGRVEEIGEGIVSRPVIDVVNEDVVIQGSDTSIHVRDTVGIIQRLIVRSWRQLWN